VAPPAGQIRPAKYLGAFVLIVVALYSLVFFTGTGKATPKLGIDLQGGTRVTLTARAPDGKTPTDEALNQARTLIETRVNGLGVSGSEVVRDGTNLVITVPGADGEGAKSLGKTARLAFRKVVGQPLPNQPAVQPPATSGSTPPPSGSATPPPSGSNAPSATAGSTPPSSGAPQGRPAPMVEGQPSTTTPPPSSSDPSQPPASSAAQPPAAQVDCMKVFAGEYSKDVPTAIKEAKACRQDPALTTLDDATVGQALQAFTCPTVDPLLGNDDFDKPLLTCDQNRAAKYVLAPVNPAPDDKTTKPDDFSLYSRLTGEDIADATSGSDPKGAGFVVSLTFKGEGGSKWGKFTSANTNKQVAVVLDSQVVSAPNINEPILGGSTQISGKFTQQQAAQLANVLKYGSLPLSFEASEAQTVSATLGLASLKAGLIAGGIGLGLVFIYCLFYYRLLGILTILSLLLSGGVVYAVLVLLGRWIGFTLDLAGIAGFIVSIGITADSFVVFFERLKDEVRDGRSFRSAVPRAWVRSRRTILSADAVSFLASAILYVIAVGQVKGFAFTLGMSTVLDLVVVFLVTHPLVVMASKSKFLSNPKVSGLGGAQQAGVDQRAHAGSKSTAVKEA
jgi:preprotein translocase subunit SecD